MVGFLNPEGILKSLNIFKPGMRVADLGCGAGYFSIPLAQLVTDQGQVYAVDVQQHALDLVAQRARQANITNIELIRANLEKVGSTGLPSGALDGALLATILFQSDKKQEILKESRRILQDGGFFVIIDWDPQSPIGEGSYKVGKEEAVKLATETGFSFQQEFAVDSYHYGLLFKS